jgi:hypothetical protein
MLQSLRQKLPISLSGAQEKMTNTGMLPDSKTEKQKRIDDRS